MNQTTKMSLNDIKKIELRMLLEVDRICRLNNICYTLVGGTLLGAVRHKGFIPWDDDIDVGMPRPDYEKFISLFDRYCNNDDYYIVDKSVNDGSKSLFIKVCDRRTIVETKVITSTNNLYIDIFPIDGVSNNEKKKYRELRKAQFLKRIIVHSSSDLSSLDKFKGMSGIFVKLFHIIAKVYGKERATNLLEKLALKYDFNSSKECAIVAWASYGKGESYSKSGFDNMVELDFEGYKFFSISCWDYYLKGIYGDYMELPPEKKRKTHEMNAYWCEGES